MKNGLKNAVLLCTGMILGAALFGGSVVYATTGIFAEKSPWTASATPVCFRRLALP